MIWCFVFAENFPLLVHFTALIRSYSPQETAAGNEKAFKTHCWLRDGLQNATFNTFPSGGGGDQTHESKPWTDSDSGCVNKQLEHFVYLLWTSITDFCWWRGEEVPSFTQEYWHKLCVILPQEYPPDKLSVSVSETHLKSIQLVKHKSARLL